ncbi:MAG: FadR/GntR family transcriptional regulator [Desulfatiglandales bacterium]
MNEKSIKMSKKIFSSVRPQRISHLIETQIRQAIFDNHFGEGDRIPPERELAEMFDASRSSVREALRSLEKAGLIKVKKGVLGGAYVNISDPRPIVDSFKDMLQLGQVSLEEIRQARLAIEPPVAAEAARRAGKEDIKKLEEACQRHAEELMCGGADIGHDQSVHSLIAEISGNRVFALLMKVLTDIHASRMKGIRLDDQGKHELIRQHAQIIEGIRKGDPDMAYEEMRGHIIGIQKELSRLEKAAGDSARIPGTSVIHEIQ